MKILFSNGAYAVISLLFATFSSIAEDNIDGPLFPPKKAETVTRTTNQRDSEKMNGADKMSDTDVILTAKNIQEKDLSLEEASMILKRMLRIASGVPDGAGIRRGGDIYYRMSLDNYASDVARYITKKKSEQMTRAAGELIKTGSVETLQNYLVDLKHQMALRPDISSDGGFQSRDISMRMPSGGQKQLDTEVDSSCLRNIHLAIQRELETRETAKKEQEAVKKANAESQYLEETTQRLAGKKVILVGAEDVREQYAANEVKGDHLFKGKKLRITGVIQAVQKETVMRQKLSLETLRQENVEMKQTGRSIVVLDSQIDCYFEESEEESLVSLVAGHTAVIEGVCKGMLLGDILIENCKVRTRWDE